MKSIKKQISVFTVFLMTLLVSSTFMAIASAVPTTDSYPINGKGAAFQWQDDTGAHVINAYIAMEDSGKEPTMYVTIQHLRNVFTARSEDLEFKWNMNHITVEAKLDFIKTGTTTPVPHTIIITWLTSGNAVQGQSTLNEDNGFVLTLDGQYKEAQAVMILDPENSAMYHSGTYESTWATVFKGVGDIAVTLP